MRVGLVIAFLIFLMIVFELIKFYLKVLNGNKPSNNKFAAFLSIVVTTSLVAIGEIVSPGLQWVGERLIFGKANVINEESIVDRGDTENSTEESTVEVTTASENDTGDMKSETEENATEDPGDKVEEVSTEDEFVFPDSDTRRLLRSELEGKNEWECKIARNEIFARKGKIFDDPELQAYFESCSWYEGKNSQYEYSEYISEIEAYNVQLIREYEEEHGFNPELNVPE